MGKVPEPMNEQIRSNFPLETPTTAYAVTLTLLLTALYPRLPGSCSAQLIHPTLGRTPGVTPTHTAPGLRAWFGQQGRGLELGTGVCWECPPLVPPHQGVRALRVSCPSPPHPHFPKTQWQND